MIGKPGEGTRGSLAFFLHAARLSGLPKRTDLEPLSTRRGKYRNLHTRRKSLRTIDPLRCLLKVALPCLKNIRHKFLRIAIVKRKPCALHLHHDAMPFLENVIRRVQINRERRYRSRRDRLRFLKRIAEAPAKYLVRNHQFVAG